MLPRCLRRGKRQGASGPTGSVRRPPTSLWSYILPDVRPAVCTSLFLFHGWVLIYAATEPSYTPQAVSFTSYVRGVVALLCFHELGAVLRCAWPLLLLFDVAVLVLAAVLSAYRALSGFFIDYYVIALNVGLIKYGESFSAVPAGAAPMLLGAMTVAAVFALTCWKHLQRVHALCWSPWWAALLRALAAAWLLHALVHGHGRTLDGATELLRTMVREDPATGIHVDPVHLASLGIRWNESYPLLRPGPLPARRCERGLGASALNPAAAHADADADADADAWASAWGAETTDCGGDGDGDGDGGGDGDGDGTTVAAAQLQTEPHPRPHPQPLPHIIVLVLESFSAGMLHRRCTDCASGAFITPVINQFHDEHAHAHAFYANSIQTARGQVSMLCGSIPSWKDKIFTAHPNLPMRCLPRVLGEVGYRSMFWSSQEDVTFDNTGDAMRNMVGFDEVRAMHAGLASSPAKHWGMGWQDDESYQAFFSALDQAIAEEDAKPAGQQRPTFSVVTSVSHHMHFDHLPQSERRLYPDAPAYAMRRNHEDSLHAADRYFGVFLREMQARPALWNDSLLVVLADHSFPNGEHANLYSDNSAYEENFRIPLVLRWGNPNAKPAGIFSDARLAGQHEDGLTGQREGSGTREGSGMGAAATRTLGAGKLRLRPGPLPVRGGSQVDLAPTVLDLIGVRSAHHWWGESLVALTGRPSSTTTQSADPKLPFELPLEVKQQYSAQSHLRGSISMGTGEGIRGAGLQRLLPKYRIGAASSSDPHDAPTRDGSGHATPTRSQTSTLAAREDQAGSHGTSAFRLAFRRPFRPSILVQPYSGVYMVSVRWPWKLRFDWQSKAHVLNHLEEDPHEAVNLFGHPALAHVQATLMADLAIPVASQMMIESERLWPRLPLPHA